MLSEYIYSHVIINTLYIHAQVHVTGNPKVFAIAKGISLLYILLLNQSKIILDLIFVSIEYAVCCLKLVNVNLF